MDGASAWWSALQRWCFGTIEGALALAVAGNAAYAVLRHIALRLPKVGERIVHRWGRKLGASFPLHSLTDTQANVYWVGLRSTATVTHLVATLGLLLLLGPPLVRAGRLGWWVLTCLTAIGVFNTVNGLITLWLAYEMVNGLHGGRTKQTIVRAMLDAADEYEGGREILKQSGVKIPDASREPEGKSAAGGGSGT